MKRQLISQLRAQVTNNKRKIEFKPNATRDERWKCHLMKWTQSNYRIRRFWFCLLRWIRTFQRTDDNLLPWITKFIIYSPKLSYERKLSIVSGEFLPDANLCNILHVCIWHISMWLWPERFLSTVCVCSNSWRLYTQSENINSTLLFRSDAITFK